VLVLAFDTSTSAVTVAVARDGEVCAERMVVESNRHGELLAPLIRDALDAVSAVPADLAAIGVGVGPGPFTGLRVGLATAKAMSDALGLPAYGAGSLDLVADLHRGLGRTLAVLSDARRKQVYWARYDAAGSRLEGPELDRPEVLAERIRGGTACLAGAGAHLYREVFADFEILDSGVYPSAGALALRASARAAEGSEGDELAPLYLRRPDARPPGPPKRVTPQ
jgi:tRNA threonylcarbamoyl adenosine modification protein YeaZ